MKGTIYIGLNDNFHDPSICILDDEGNILFAEGVERPLQYKRGLGCPPDLDFYIDEVISKYINHEVKRVLIAYSWTNKSHLKAKIFSIFNHFRNPNNSLFPDVEMSIQRHVSSLNQSGAGITRVFKTKFPDIKIAKHYFNHHLCHIANAVTTFDVNNGIGLVIDGKGDDTSFSIYEVNNQEIRLIKKITSIFSLGYLYGFFTDLVGYSQLKGEEWKVMGMSAYGSEDNLFLKYFLNEVSLGKQKLESKDLVGKVGLIKKFIEENKISKEDIAFTGQYLFEKLFFEVIDVMKKTSASKTLFISGGSALNTLAVGKLFEKSAFDIIVIPNAPADDGNAIGSAMLAYQKNNGLFPVLKDKVRLPFLGSEITADEVERYIQTSGLPFKKVNNSSKYAAELLSQNKIIGWIQGRAEFGPRALGNRSILGHPGFIENKDRINKVVKFRESYRPFAPSILHEFGDDFFNNYSFSPYMEKTLIIKNEKRNVIPAVVHVDGTGRVQSVTKSINSKYYDLLTEFNSLTKIPMVINTSYNVMGKPIVHDINDVMAVFFNSSIDAVFVGDYLIERNNIK